MKKDDLLYGTEEQEQLDETMEEVVTHEFDNGFCDWPLVVYEYRRVVVSAECVKRLAERALDYVIENLEVDHGNPDEDPPKPTKAMLEAAEQFAKVMEAEYVPWRCRPTGKVIEVTEERANEICGTR